MIRKLANVLFALLIMTLPLCAMADEESSVSTPNISVTTTTGSATFTLKSDSKNAKIYYTTNGTDPTTSSTRYSKSVKVTKSCEVRAIAVESGDYSPVGYYTVTVTKARVATPTFKSTNVEGGRKITISCSGATIYYTLDGSNPTTSDSRYTSSGVVVTESCIIKAIGVRSGYQNSAIATGRVNIERLGEPKLTKSTSGSKTVYKLSGPVSGCSYYYTTDGSTPVAKTSSVCKKYSTSGITITKDCTLKFIACKSGYAPSKVYSANIEGNGIEAPTPKKTNIMGGVKVTLTSPTSGVTYYYTTDGTTPTTSDAKYTSSGIQLTKPGLNYVYLLAVKSGYSSKLFNFSLNIQQLAKPTLTKVSTSTSSSASIKVRATGPSGSSIYYTTNGDDPTTSSKKITSGSTITISSSCTFKMIAAKSGYANSDVFSTNLTVSRKVATPTVRETKYTDYNKVTISCATSGATIYYTTDGSDPLYFGESIKSGTTLKLEDSCLLKAVAVKEDYDISDTLVYQVLIKGDTVTPLGGFETSWIIESDNSAGPGTEEIKYADNGAPDTVKETAFPDLGEGGEIKLNEIGGNEGYSETVIYGYTDEADAPAVDFGALFDLDDAVEL